MAAVQKSKARQRAAASVVIGLEDEADVARQAALAKCVSKVSHLKRVIYKSAFSQTPDLPRRIAERNLDLAKRLDGHDPLAFLLDVKEPSLDAAELEQLHSARQSAMSDDTIVLTELSAPPREQITYKELLDHVEKMREDYEALQLTKKIRESSPGLRKDDSSGLLSRESKARDSKQSKPSVQR